MRGLPRSRGMGSPSERPVLISTSLGDDDTSHLRPVLTDLLTTDRMSTQVNSSMYHTADVLLPTRASSWVRHTGMRLSRLAYP
jgi:hypothetical protein